MLDIGLDLLPEGIHAIELSLGPQILDEADIHILTVNFSIKIEQVNFECALGPVATNRRPERPG